MDALAAVEAVARDSYGRLVAYLSARSCDVAGAEDALSEALHAALTTWPRHGVPDKPEAWLLATARRRLIDESRRFEVRERAVPIVQQLMEDAPALDAGEPFPDERLKLLFICAHPAIDAGARTALMLQTVMGLDAARIASAFLVAPAAMSQRLVRAKSKIRLAGIPFELPDAAELPARLDTVLDAIYAAYGTGWEDAAGSDLRLQNLTREAIWLARVLIRLLPNEAEAHGLLSLMLHCEARRAARRSAVGDYVPLSEQDTSLWSRLMLDEAERELVAAAALGPSGRFQLEAAIQSVHSHRILTGRTEWNQIVQLYDELIRRAPTLTERYRLDDLWLLECYYREAGSYPLLGKALIEQVRSVWVLPPTNFSGIWTTYWINGQRANEIYCTNGRYQGTFTGFYSDGKMACIQHFKNGRADGEDTGYFRSGRTNYLGLYRDGKQVGIWVWFNEDGSTNSVRDCSKP